MKDGFDKNNKKLKMIKENGIRKNYIRRKSGLITPYDDKDDERYAYFPQNYDLIAHYIPSEYKTQPRLFVEDCRLDKNFVSRRYIDPEKQAYEIANNTDLPIEEGKIIDPRKLQKYLKREKVCRFCEKGKPDKRFKEKAHAISELIGNNTVYIRNECDCCNDIFSTYEDSFAKYLGPLRTICQIEGKNKIPAYLDNDNTISLEVGDRATVIQEISGTNHVEISDKQIDIELEKQTYIPLDAYKALVTMALSIMPENEFKSFRSTADWLINNKNDLELSGYASQVIIRFLPGPSPLKLQTWLLRRKSILTGSSAFEVPYCHFIIEFNNFSFQIIVPNVEKDAVLLGRRIIVPMFISSFDYFSGLRKYGEPNNQVHDFSSKDKVEGEKQRVQLSSESCEDITDRETAVQNMASREGVTPLFEKVRKRKKTW